MLPLALLILTAAVGLDAACPCGPAAPTDAVCGSDATTYDSACALDCAARVNRGLTVAHKGACKTSRSVIDIKMCTDVCYEKGVDCQSKCTTTACKDECVFDHFLECSCACKPLLYINPDEGEGNPFPLMGSLKKQISLYRKNVSSKSLGDDLYRCYFQAVLDNDACGDVCLKDPPTYIACGTKCSEEALNKVCYDCNPRKLPTESPIGSSSMRATSSGLAVLLAAALFARCA